MIDRLEFLMSEAFVAMRRNGWMTFAAISTAAVALFLLGGLAYIFLRTSEAIGDFSRKFEIRVFLEKDVSYEKIKQTAVIIRSFDGVKSVTHIPKESAWKKWLASDPELVGGLDNVLPDAFKVTLTDLSKSEQVKKKLQDLAVVRKDDGVVSNTDQEKLVQEVLSMTSKIGGGLGILMVLTAGVLIYNAIRLTVVARRREIRIMQLVGATQFTVRTPFVIEGIIQGMLGGVIAAGLIWFSQRSLEGLVREFSIGKSWPEFPLLNAICIIGAVGGAFGALCSWMAVREPLRMRSTVQR